MPGINVWLKIHCCQSLSCRQLYSSSDQLWLQYFLLLWLLTEI